VLLSSAKTEDYFFTGFPSYWNIVAVYLHAFALNPAVNAAILIALAAMVFVRIGYVYPTRTPVLRGLTIALCAAWGLMIIGIIVSLPDPPFWLVTGSLFFPVYYTVLSLVLNARRR
jgi:phosphatidylcholine synthase